MMDGVVTEIEVFILYFMFQFILSENNRCNFLLGDKIKAKGI